MIFRPRIFISSTFSDNKEIRKRIEEYFKSVGAEPMLYERNLTPSTIPMTYRENIKEADFVILIMKNNYGTKTDRDISGTHEEYIIAHENKIPMHVYLFVDKEEESSGDNPLIDDLQKDQISYFYFDDDDNLFERLKETTFTIAKEIMLNQIVKNTVPRNSVMKLAGNLDYNRAMEVVQIIESMRVCIIKNELDWLEDNLLYECLWMINHEFSAYPHSFLNWRLDELLRGMLSAFQQFQKEYVNSYSKTNNLAREYNISVLGKIPVLSAEYQARECREQRWQPVFLSNNPPLFQDFSVVSPESVNTLHYERIVGF